jgi:acid phosphatase type 7
MRGLWRMRRRLAAVLTLVVAVGVLGAAGTASAASATITATEDSYTSQGNASATHGSSGSLTVNGAPGERRAYVKFTVTGIPAGSTEVSAVLRLWVSRSSSATFTARAVPTSWSESTLTWSNQPALGTALASVTGVTAGQYRELDVSGHVSGNGTFALAVTGSSTQARFTSTESGTGGPPELAVTWTPPTTPPTTPPPGGDDPVVAAAGDIACMPPATRTSSSCHHRETSNLLVAGDYDAVLPLGDLQYECGQASAYQSVYDPTWGRVKAVSRPAAGDNEYGSATCSTSGASGYFSYFGGAASPNQPGCRTACPGYYSYDLGTWHVVVLNTNCSEPGVGGCSSSSAQGRWLAADLAAHPNQCTLAYWHLPRWTESGGVSSTSNYLVSALYNAGADVLLAGNNHFYARFAPQSPSGAADPVNGIRQFIVGTGGKSLHGLSGRPDPQVEARQDTTYGILELTLHASSYSWRFVPEAGRSFTDAGSQACH